MKKVLLSMLLVLGFCVAGYSQLESKLPLSEPDSPKSQQQQSIPTLKATKKVQWEYTVLNTQQADDVIFKRPRQ